LRLSQIRLGGGWVNARGRKHRKVRRNLAGDALDVGGERKERLIEDVDLVVSEKAMTVAFVTERLFLRCATIRVE
jgi:hypothetical protein